MKILQIISGRGVNGALTYCKFASEQLQEFGHQVTVVGRSDSWLKSNLAPGIAYLESDLDRRPLELKRIAKVVTEGRFDVMHTHMSRAHSFGVILKMMTRTPVVATAHAHSFQVHWRLNDFVIANSQTTYDYQLRVNRIPEHKMEKVFCFTGLQRFEQVTPLDVTRVRRQMRLKGTEFLVGVVGDFVARKGHKYLFEALPKVIKEVPNVKIVTIGRYNRGELLVKKLRAYQLNNNLLCRVKWLGCRSNVHDFMAAFDLCVVPSVIEPLGLVALEAMAAGTPVVAANTGGLSEIVEHRSNGLLVRPRDSQQLADAIIEMAKSQSARQAMGESGRQMVNEKFNPIELTRQVERILGNVSAARRAA